MCNTCVHIPSVSVVLCGSCLHDSLLSVPEGSNAEVDSIVRAKNGAEPEEVAQLRPGEDAKEAPRQPSVAHHGRTDCIAPASETYFIFCCYTGICYTWKNVGFFFPLLA